MFVWSGGTLLDRALTSTLFTRLGLLCARLKSPTSVADLINMPVPKWEQTQIGPIRTLKCMSNAKI